MRIFYIFTLTNIIKKRTFAAPYKSSYLYG